MKLSEAAMQHFVLAEFGQTIAPFLTFIMLATGLALLALLTPWLNAAKSGRQSLIGFAAVMAAFVLVAYSKNDYKLAQLFDAPAVELGVVSSANESGGGCSPLRTSIVLKDGTGLTVAGPLNLRPGETVSRKKISFGELACRGDGTTTECAYY